jgi:ASC-1-like (ASCH) protein
LAVFVEPFLQYVLEGKKTVESRFSINKCAPFASVKPGDLVLIKSSGGPVKAFAEVANVWSYRLTGAELPEIKHRFGALLCVDDTFWRTKVKSCYATLMKFSSVQLLEPVYCEKKDRRGWVVLGYKSGELFAPDTGSLRQRSSQALIHFGSVATK